MPCAGPGDVLTFPDVEGAGTTKEPEPPVLVIVTSACGGCGAGVAIIEPGSRTNEPPPRTTAEFEDVGAAGAGAATELLLAALTV